MFSDPVIKEHKLQAVLAERCDGNRNIFHACISNCVPISNTETPVPGIVCLANPL